jgi:hypothetical protein
MDMDELMREVLKTFPKADVGEDNDGQLVIYTNLTLDANQNVVPFKD